MVIGTTEFLVGFTGLFGDIFETVGMTGVVLDMGGMCLGVSWVLLGTFLVGKGLSSLGVVGIFLDKDIVKFDWRLVEVTVGVTGDCERFAGLFVLVVSNEGLEGEGLGRDPFRIVGLMAIDFAIVDLEGFTGADFEVICFELVGFDLVVGFMLAGFDTLLGFELEGFDRLVGFELLGFGALVGFELKAFDILVCFELLGFDTLMGFKKVGFGLANICNGFTVTVLA